MSELTKEILRSIRRAVALQLWDLGAIKVNLDQPFRLTSGNYSPIYINCRQLISSTSFADLFAATARMLCDAQGVRFDIVAGGETAGIPFAAFLARSFGKPMIYVRKETKAHGISSLVEGSFPSGARVLLAEDLITDAGSKLHFIEAIQAAGGIVNDVLVVFDRQQGGGETLQEKGIQLHAASDMDTALSVATEAAILSKDQSDTVKTYLIEPEEWHRRVNRPYIRKE